MSDVMTQFPAANHDHDHEYMVPDMVPDMVPAPASFAVPRHWAGETPQLLATGPREEREDPLGTAGQAFRRKR